MKEGQTQEPVGGMKEDITYWQNIKEVGYPKAHRVVEVWIEENEMPFMAIWRDDGLGFHWHSEAYEVEENKNDIKFWRGIRLDSPYSTQPTEPIKTEQYDTGIQDYNEFDIWRKGITAGKNTTVSDLYYYWENNIKSAPIKTEGEDEGQLFEKFPELAKSIEWFANNVLCPGTEWNKLLSEINKALSTPPSPVGIDVEELILAFIVDALHEKYPSSKKITAGILYILSKAGFSASLPQSSTEEEKDLWEEVSKIVIKHYTSYNYTDQDSNELQSKFKISKR